MAHKLTKVELAFIEQNYEDQTPQAIAKELGRSLTAVKKAIGRFKEAAAPEPEDKVTTTKPATKMQELLQQSTKKRGKGSSVVLTPAVAELADETRQPGKISHMKNCIHKPRG